MIKRPEQNYDQISLPDLKEYTVCKDKLIAENSVNDFIFKIVFKMISFTYSVFKKLHLVFVCFLLFSIATSYIRFLHHSVEILPSLHDWSTGRNNAQKKRSKLPGSQLTAE